MAADVRVAVVGAGPHALTIAVHLACADPTLSGGDLVVLDPSGTWMTAWRDRFARLGISHLRSPAVHQPHPDPWALLNHAAEEGRADEFAGRYRVPGASLFDHFCDRLIDEHRLAVREATVATVEPEGTIICSEGQMLRAEHVVLAHAPQRAVWVSPLDGSATHADTIDVRTVRDGTRLTVVGGGITAGHLAIGAVERGAHVTLVSRRPLREQDFDMDAGWLGPKLMRGYLATRSLEQRARRAVAARDGGSMPAWMIRRLDQLRAAGRLDVRCGPCGEEPADAVWLATGWAPDPTADPLIGPLVATTGTRCVGPFVGLAAGLRLPRTSIQVVGRLATLSLGPTAGNLSGARQAALDVVARVCGVHAADRLRLT